MAKAFTTCAVTGTGLGHTKSPHVPITQTQIADAVIETGIELFGRAVMSSAETRDLLGLAPTGTTLNENARGVSDA